MQKSFRYIPAVKSDAPKNPLILNAQLAGWTFWSMAAVVGGLIVVAVYWLLAHPVA